MAQQEQTGLKREIRTSQKEAHEELPRTLEEIRKELGELKIEKRTLRIQVTEEEREREEEVKQAVEEKISKIETILEGEINENTITEAAGHFSTSAQLIHESRISGLFELFELAEFDDKLIEQYDRLKEKAPETPSEAQDGFSQFEGEMSKEFLLRELEHLYNDTTQQIRGLYEGVQAATPAAVSGSAEGLCKCADDLFNFEIGGVLRIDEFVSYVNVLRENHAAILKLSIGKEAELPNRFATLMQEVEEMIRKHESNLEDVKKLLEGGENIMSFERYNELAIELQKNYKFYIEWQRQMVKESHSESVSALQAGEISKDRANWSGMGTTQSGRRFQIGLRGKKGCEYGRCANCCLFHGSSDASVTAENIVTQFDTGLEEEGLVAKEGQEKLEWEDSDKSDVYRIDFNGSGSFFNDDEMPRDARIAIFEKIAKLPFTTILIESRVEYIDEEKIKELQNLLRPDQKIEMAIGLESANNLVRELSVAKGYSLEEFEKSVEVLARNDVDVLVYSIVKPALLKEAEALEDSLYTGRYLAELVERVREKTQSETFSLTMKLEQSFIQKGGYLDYLHNKKQKDSKNDESLYETPWSFTIAEIVQRLCDEKINDLVNIQIGRSDDYPPPVDITKNRTADGEMHSESTEAVDQVMQEFNVDGDAEALSAKLEEISKTYPDVFQAWQKKLDT